MTTIKLRTRDQTDGRIFVTDGQGTSASYNPIGYPRDARAVRHRAAAHQFLAELKGWPDAKVNTSAHLADGYELTAERHDGEPSRRRKPVHVIRNVERYLESRREVPVDDMIDVITSSKDEPHALTVSDLQALLDYIREA